jgi:hypothetical protein
MIGFSPKTLSVLESFQPQSIEVRVLRSQGRPGFSSWPSFSSTLACNSVKHLETQLPEHRVSPWKVLLWLGWHVLLAG